jgi:hypothetical protein
MKPSASNNRKFYSILFLVVYLFFFITGIFHNHNINSIGEQSFSINKSSHYKDPYAADQSICLISQLNNSIHNYFYSSLSINAIFAEIEKFRPNTNNLFTINIFLLKNLLRAPPSHIV